MRGTLDVAGVSISKNGIVLNFKSHNRENKLYKVKFETFDGELIVTGERPKYGYFIPGYTEPPEDLSVFDEEDLHMVRDWPFFWRWKKTVKPNRWVEYKERTPVRYTSNNYVIID